MDEIQYPVYFSVTLNFKDSVTAVPWSSVAVLVEIKKQAVLDDFLAKKHISCDALSLVDINCHLRSIAVDLAYQLASRQNTRREASVAVDETIQLSVPSSFKDARIADKSNENYSLWLDEEVKLT